jgi:signal transduction histidine kinase
MRAHSILLSAAAVTLAGWGVADALLVGWSSPAPVSVVVALLAGLPIAWLNRRPYVAAGIVTVVLVVHGVLWSQPEAPPETLALLVVAFGIGAYGAASYPLWAVFCVGALVVELRDLDDPGAGGVLFMVGSWVVALAVGRAVSQREDAEHEDRQVARSTRQASAEVTAAALASERDRIARDLHDVVTASVALMMEQAAIGHEVVRTAPHTAEAALVAVEEIGQQALGELRRMLGLIRGTAGTPGPQPGLAALPALAEAAGAALTIDGDLDSVPEGPAIAAYRIVQEALIDARRHTPDASRRIAIFRTADHLELEVVSTGERPAASREQRQVAGMRRRAEMYGGALEVGSTPDGGWCVRTVLSL